MTAVVAGPPRTAADPVPPGGRVRRRRAAKLAVAVALPLVAFGALLPRIASYDDVWDHLAAIPAGNAGLVALAGILNVASYWPLLMIALPGLTLRQAMLSNQVSTAVANTVPAGSAVGTGVTVGMYRGWGFEGSAIARALLVSGLWNILVKLATPLWVAVAITVASDNESHPAIAVVSGVALIGVILAVQAVFRWPAVTDRMASGLERAVSAACRAVGRPPVEGLAEAAQRVRFDAGELVRARWPVLTLAAVASHAALFLVLLATLEALDVPGVSTLEALGAFAVVRVALVVPVTPGGAGLAELGLAGMLVASGGSRPAVVAAVLLFRAVTWLVPVAVGAVAYGLWVRERVAAWR